MAEPSLVFRLALECVICGKELDWRNDLGSQPQADGSEVFAVQIAPHTCDLDEIKDICRVGDRIDEDDLWEVLTEEAAWVGWPEEEANEAMIAERRKNEGAG